MSTHKCGVSGVSKKIIPPNAPVGFANARNEVRRRGRLLEQLYPRLSEWAILSSAKSPVKFFKNCGLIRMVMDDIMIIKIIHSDNGGNYTMIYVVGHRGAAGVEPENTLKGFRYALELGVDYTECDVHLTKDNQLIVMHDETVDRTTNGTGAIRALTFAEIRSLDAGEDEVVPTLTEVLEVVKDRAILLIELKGEGVEEQAVETVKEMKMDKRVIFTSFHLDRIRKVKSLDSALKVGAIFGQPPVDASQQALDAGASGIGVHYRNLRRELVEEAHCYGLDVRAWNPDTVPEMQAMINMGVDGVSTNRPDLLIPLIRS